MSPPKTVINNARDLAETNTTSTLFLGARNKTWMYGSSVPHPVATKSPKPSKKPKPKPSRLRLNTHSATNSVSSTHSVTRDDWSSSTNGEDPVRTSEVDVEVDREPIGLLSHASNRPLDALQPPPVVHQGNVPDIPHSLRTDAQDKATVTQADHGETSTSPPAAPRRPQTSPEALPPEMSTTPDVLTTETTGSTDALPELIEVDMPSSPETDTVHPARLSPDDGRAAGARSQVESTAVASRPSNTAAVEARQQDPAPVAPVTSGLNGRYLKKPFSVTLHTEAERIRTAYGQTELDRARINFIIEASETDEHDAARSNLCGLLSEGANTAFDILDYVLGPNSSLTKRLERYLLDFPAPHSNLYQAAFKSHVLRMSTTLNLLARNWDDSIDECASRGFPYSPAEVRETFGLSSRRLSIAFFTAMLHRLGINGSAAVRLFDEYYPTPCSLNQWRHSFSQAMSNHSQQSSVRRSVSSNGRGVSLPCPMQSPSAGPSNHHLQNYQSIADTMPGPNRRVSTPASQNSAIPGVQPDFLRPPQVIQTGSNHQQGMSPVQPQQYTQRTEYHGSQYPGPHQPPRPPSTFPAVTAQQQHPQSMNGPANQSGPGPRPGVFIYQSRLPGMLPPQPLPRTHQQQPMQNQPYRPPQQQTPLLPPPGFSMPQAVHPVADRVALHQANLREPDARILDLQGKLDNDLRLYQSTAKLDIMPHRLSPADHITKLNFDISPADIGNKLVLNPPPERSLTRPSNLFKPGALRWRVKCIARPLSDDSEPTESDFCCSASSWPEHIFISFNQLDDIIPRRKTHYGRDLASDLTNAVTEGQNQLVVSFDGSTTDKRYRKNYWIGVERIELVSRENIIKNLQSRPHDDALARILKSMKGGAPPAASSTTAPTSADTSLITPRPPPSNPVDSPNDESDDDLIITNPTLSISLTDPFTSVLWTIPVRTLTCRHRECFDLETFLSSRPRLQGTGPSEADDWKCPHCQRDARPGQLVRDDFLAGVGEKLVKEGREGARVLEVAEDGSWVAKGDEEGKKGERDGKGAREEDGTPVAEGGREVGEGGAGANVEGIASGMGAGSGRQSRAVSSDVVMVLDDDDD